jgi:hypothetical protein
MTSPSVERLYLVAELRDGCAPIPLPPVYARSACDAAAQSVGDGCHLIAMRWGDGAEDTFVARIRERDGRTWTVRAMRANAEAA